MGRRRGEDIGDGGDSSESWKFDIGNFEENKQPDVTKKILY
jgi:hypothetical protein